MRSRSNLLWRYGPLVLWATLIFLASSDLFSGSHTGGLLFPVLRRLFPHASEATLTLIHEILIRKSAHLAAYAILAVFAAHAFGSSLRESVRSRWFLISMVFVVVYSLTDEYHQSFVPSRSASIYDCLIDSVGGLIALTLIWFRKRRKSAKALDGLDEAA